MMIRAGGDKLIRWDVDKNFPRPLSSEEIIGKFFLQFDVTFVFTWKAALIAAVLALMSLMFIFAMNAWIRRPL